MPEIANKRCPFCGKRPVDRRLVQCPDCKVPFSYETDPATQPPRPQPVNVAREILGSVKFWMGMALLVAAAAFGVAKLTERQTADHLNAMGRDYFNSLDEKTSNHVSEQISMQVSNQIDAQFRQPRIKATMEQVAADRAQDLLTNAVWASLETFRAGIEQASAQLAKSTNDLAQVSRDIRLAQRMASQMASAGTEPPAMLILASQTVATNGSNYILTLFFKTTNDRPVGTVDLIAGTYRQTSKIVSFAARAPLQSDAPMLNDAADAARLTFNVARADTPIAVDLEVNGPTIVKFVGDVLQEELTIPIAADKMQVPLGAK
jgi:hypothetical protein